MFEPFSVEVDKRTENKRMEPPYKNDSNVKKLKDEKNGTAVKTVPMVKSKDMRLLKCSIVDVLI